MVSKVALPSTYYDEDYYHGRAGKSNYTAGYTWDSFGYLFTALAQLVGLSFPDITSVLDVGCATGLFVRALRARGLGAWGLEQSAYCLTHADPHAQPYLYHQDLTDLRLEQDFDLITACETLEHLTADQLALALPRLASHTRLGLFATVPTPDMWHRGAWLAAMREPSHVTLQPREWWYAQFTQAGFLTSPFHQLAERYFHAHPLVIQMGWNVFCLGV